MDARAKAEQDVIKAADCWAREILRSDRLLNFTEQNLLNSTINYSRIIKLNGLNSLKIPPPPLVPKELRISQIPTSRYSDYSTVPSPPQNSDIIKTSSSLDGDIIKISESPITDSEADAIFSDILEQEDLWTGKQKQ